MAFLYSRPIVIDYTKCGSADSIQFPMLFSGTFNGSGTVDLRSTANGGKVINTNGYDIRFFSDPKLSSSLPFELESYNATTGAATFWVRVPVLSSSANTTIYLGYGNPYLSTNVSSTNTWDSNYLAVYHMGDGSTLSLADSTSNGLTLTNQNTATAAAGQVGGAVSLNGSNQYLQTASNMSLGGTNLTIETWAKSTTFLANQMIVEHQAVNATWAFFMENSGTTGLKIRGNGISDNCVYTTTITGSTWHHLCVSLANDAGIIYLDGSSVKSALTSTIADTSNKVNIGCYDGTGYFWNGQIDEVRISKSIRSASWVTASYNSQSSPSTFYAIGTEAPSVGAGGFGVTTGMSTSQPGFGTL